MSSFARARLSVRAAVAVAVIAAGGTIAVAATPAGAAGFTGHYAVTRSLCAQPTDPAQFRCFAMERVPVAAGTRGAYKVDYGHGHIGGYSPNDLAKAYGYNPNASVSQTVGIVDWYDDPYVARDLNTFDQAYGLPIETSRSFRKVNQSGHASPLPRASRDSTETALDVEAVRAVCHKCRILLVEANNPSSTDLAAAENTAVRLGANEVSNSFGGAESGATAGMISAFRHPGVVITASTGDDGWNGWDGWNFAQDPNDTDDEPSFPASDPYVVSVGGTSLTLNSDGSHFDETVWNDNGDADAAGLEQGPLGATGGGCSGRFTAASWQWHDPGYASTGCGDHGRVAADVAADADPHTGFDVLDRYGQGGWITVGGTSLSSPIIAAMYALAGGSGGSAYPAASLYINSNSANTFDVQSGGSGFCGSASAATCSNAVLQDSGTYTNPNNWAESRVDCSFAPTNAPAQCNATTGYDGPSGLGTPKGLGLFKPTSGVGYLSVPTLARLRQSQAFTAHVWERLPNSAFTTFAWHWGDGTTSATTSGSTHHTYTRAGHYVVSVTVSDTLHQVIVRSHSFTVGMPPSVHYSGPTTLRRGQSGAFTDRGSHAVNTGAHIASVVWNWGDGHSTTASSTHHTYTRTGTYTVTLTIKDTTGVSRSVHHSVRITS